MEKRISLWKLAICILVAGLFDGAFTYLIADVLKIPLFLDTIGLLTITFTFGGIPGLITALFSQFFTELIGGYLNFWIFLYVFCSFSAVGVVCIFKKYIEKASTPISLVVILFLVSVLMCLVVSITGGLVNILGDFFHESIMGNIQTDYYKLSLFRMKISALYTDILCRFPVNIIDRPISTFASFGLSFLLKKLFHLEKK